MNTKSTGEKMERGNFVLVGVDAVTTVLGFQSGIRAKYLEKDLKSYDRIGLVVKIKENETLNETLVCLSFGSEIYWFKKTDLTLIKK